MSSPNKSPAYFQFNHRIAPVAKKIAISDDKDEKANPPTHLLEHAHCFWKTETPIFGI
jgi:hypothetical protein